MKWRKKTCVFFTWRLLQGNRRPIVVNHEGQAGVNREFLCDAPFPSTFPCLSRACLGKKMMFSIKMAQKGRVFFAPARCGRPRAPPPRRCSSPARSAELSRDCFISTANWVATVLYLLLTESRLVYSLPARSAGSSRQLLSTSRRRRRRCVAAPRRWHRRRGCKGRRDRGGGSESPSRRGR
eukprot:COSAG06_NODE_12983_length_1306_cov_1.000000_1_plen_181_part_00